MLVCFFHEVRLRQLQKDVQEEHQLHRRRTIYGQRFEPISAHIMLKLKHDKIS